MNKSEKFWDRTAKNFDNGESRFEPIHVKTIENSKKYLNENDTVLDYGCATGTKAFALAGHVKKIQSIDISSKMIEGAKSRAVEQNIENVDFLHATLFDERLGDESFDVVLAFNILHLLEDQKQALQRISNLLKPGGLFISNTPCLKEKMAFLNRSELTFALLLMKIGLLPDMLTSFKFSDLEELIAQARLQIVEGERTYFKISGYFAVAKKV